MKIGIIICICMTCMSAVALAVGGQIRTQASQSEKIVPSEGNVTLLCPLVPNDLWIWVHWQKNNQTIYSLEVKSSTPWTNSTRYEGSDHATRLTIKDLKKTDSGIYHCKVATLRFIKERGHVLLSVTDQEVGLSTTSPGVSLTASTTIPPQPAEDNTISSDYLIFILFISIIISVIISVTIVCLVFKYRERIRNLHARIVSASIKKACKSTSTPLDPVSSHLEIGDEAPRSTSTPLGPDSSHHEIRDEEGTRIYLLSSDTHGRDDVDVDDRIEEIYC